jgi:hypothetical protein
MKTTATVAIEKKIPRNFRVSRPTMRPNKPAKIPPPIICTTKGAEIDLKRHDGCIGSHSNEGRHAKIHIACVAPPKMFHAVARTTNCKMTKPAKKTYSLTFIMDSPRNARSVRKA